MNFFKKVVFNFILSFFIPFLISYGAYWGIDPIKPHFYNFGDAYSAASGSASSLLVNPAGASNAVFNQVFLSGWKDYGLIYNGYLSVLFSAADRVKIGQSIYYRTIKNIEKTSYNGVSASAAGKFNYNSYMYISTIAYEIKRRINSGVNIKIFRENLTDTIARDAVSLDFGAQFLVSDFLQVGVNFENLVNSGFLSKNLKYELMPVNLRFGGMLNLYSGRLQLLTDYDLHRTRDYLYLLHFGARYLINDRMGVNIGIENNSVYSGFNYSIDGFTISYSLNYAFRLLSLNSNIGISWNFGRKYNLVKKGKEYYYKGELYDSLKRWTKILEKNPNDRLATYFVKKIFLTYQRNNSLKFSLNNFKEGKRYWADYWLNKAKYFDGILRDNSE